MSEPSFDRRDLIRHMPELLAGKEPELLKPESRRFLLEDGECRALIHAAAETAIALDSGMSRMRRSARVVSPVLRRPMEQVKRHFARRMVDVFWDQAMAAFAEATPHSDTFIENVHDREWRVLATPELIASMSRICLALEIHERDERADVARRVITGITSESRGLECAEHLITGCSALATGLEGVAVAKLHARTLSNAASAGEWKLAAKIVEGPATKAICLREWARTAFLAQESSQAIELCKTAMQLAPDQVGPTIDCALYLLSTSDGMQRHNSVRARFTSLVLDNHNRIAERWIRSDHRAWAMMLRGGTGWSALTDRPTRDVIESWVERGAM